MVGEGLGQVLRPLRRLMAVTDIDEAKLEAFAGLVATELGAALNAALVTLGDELGLYRSMADGQPVSAAELAARTGTQERYVREWLNVQAASGFVLHEDDAFVLPPEHALVLADESSPFLMTAASRPRTPPSRCASTLAERFVDGDGLGWHEHHHGLWHGTARAFGDHVPHVPDRRVAAGARRRRGEAEAGALVADVGCGHGVSTILMAQAFPTLALRGHRLPRGLDRDRAPARRRRGRRGPRDASRSPAPRTSRVTATT